MIALLGYLACVVVRKAFVYAFHRLRRKVFKVGLSEFCKRWGRGDNINDRALSVCRWEIKYLSLNCTADPQYHINPMTIVYLALKWQSVPVPWPPKPIASYMQVDGGYVVLTISWDNFCAKTTNNFANITDR